MEPKSQAGLADRMKGLGFTFLLSLATEKKFVGSLGLGCESAFDEIFDDSCVDWREGRVKAEQIPRKRWKTVKLYMPPPRSKQEMAMRKRISTINLQNVAGKGGFIELKADSNLVYYEDVVHNVHKTYFVSSLLHRDQPPAKLENFKAIASVVLLILHQTSR